MSRPPPPLRGAALRVYRGGGPVGPPRSNHFESSTSEGFIRLYIFSGDRGEGGVWGSVGGRGG